MFSPPQNLGALGPLWDSLDRFLQAAVETQVLSDASGVALQGILAASEGRFEAIPPHAAACLGELIVGLDQRRGPLRRAFGPGLEGQARIQGLQTRLHPLSTLRPPSEADLTITAVPGLELFPHQEGMVRAALKAIKEGLDPALPWSPVSPKDRGYIIAPPQTGKTTAVSVIANEARRLFRGKQVLFLSVSDAVTQNVLKDAGLYFKGTVTQVNAETKDISGDLVIASVFSLVNLLSDPMLTDRFAGERFGLVILDEMTWGLTNTCLAIARWLGFVDDIGRPQRAPGKFLLGLGATALRGDGRHLREIFGDRELFNRGVIHYMENGFYQPFDGLDLTYDAMVDDWEILEGEGEGETVLTMTNTPRNNRKIIEIYQGEKDLAGRKVIIWCTTQDHAHDLARDFNRHLGQGTAEAVTARLSPKAGREILNGFNAGMGPKVLIGVKKFGLSFRAHETAGVLFTYLSTSYNDFIQKASRPLARNPEDPAFPVLIVTVRPKDVPFTQGHTAASLLGFRFLALNRRYSPGRERHHRPSDEELNPEELDEGKVGYLKIIRRQRLRIHMRSLKFGRLWERLARQRFGGDYLKMAETLGLSPSQCRSYALGNSPDNYPEALCAIGRKLGPRDFDRLSKAWLDDHMRLVEMAYPYPKDASPEVIALSRLIRRGVLLRSKGSLREFFELFPESEGDYSHIAHAFQGRKIHSLPAVVRFILETGAADEVTLRRLVGRFQRGHLRHDTLIPFYREEAEPSEASYLDALSDRRPRSLSTVSEARLRSAFEVFDEAEPSRLETPEESLMRRELAGLWSEFFARLDRKRSFILNRRFDLDGEGANTLNEVGDALEISRERARQLQWNALEEFRNFLISKGVIEPPYPPIR